MGFGTRGKTIQHCDNAGTGLKNDNKNMFSTSRWIRTAQGINNSTPTHSLYNIFQVKWRMNQFDKSQENNKVHTNQCNKASNNQSDKASKHRFDKSTQIQISWPPSDRIKRQPGSIKLTKRGAERCVNEEIIPWRMRRASEVRTPSLQEAARVRSSVCVWVILFCAPGVCHCANRRYQD